MKWERKNRTMGYNRYGDDFVIDTIKSGELSSDIVGKGERDCIHE